MCFGVSCSVDLNIESSRFGVSEHVKDLHVPMGATTFVAICADVSSVLTQTPKPSRVQNRQLLSRSSSHFIREWNRYTDSRLKVRRFGIQSQDIASICVALRSRASNALVPLVLHLLRPFGWDMFRPLVVWSIRTWSWESVARSWRGFGTLATPGSSFADWRDWMCCTNGV